MRQEPETDTDRMKRIWRAWGICTTSGTLAELTMDRDKAVVWKQGGHKVIEFSHEEPIEYAGEPADGVQGKLL